MTGAAEHQAGKRMLAAHDTRCGTCFSFLFSVMRDGARVHVSPWFEITDDLPQFDEHAS